jgi:tRNA (mo5U34)-methyltransferase
MNAIDILSPEEIRRRAKALGPWFHNLDLNGVRTAPEHFLGDYPAVKWRSFADAIPKDLTGKSVLDIGCNGGFYSMEMKKRGAARVLGVDFDEDYLAQARFAAQVTGLDIEFRQLSVYDVGALGERFDVVLFMGVLYHLRYPLLALDAVARVVDRLLVLQTLTMPGEQRVDAPADLDIEERARLLEDGWPRMAFVEHKLADDETNWWAPNAAAVEAMARSAGLDVVEHPAHEIWVCRPGRGFEHEDELRAASGRQE